MKEKKNSRKILFYIIFVLLLLAFLYPFFLVVMNSFKTNKEVILNPVSLPAGLNIDGYLKAYENMNYLQSFGNSLFVTVDSVLMLVLISVMCAQQLEDKQYRADAYGSVDDHSVPDDHDSGRKEFLLAGSDR